MYLRSCFTASGSSSARLDGVWYELVDEICERGVLGEGGVTAAVWLERTCMLFMRLPLKPISGMMLSLTGFASDAKLPIREAGNCDVICETATFQCDRRTHGAKRQT
jgi:hypothetical protein